MRFILSVGLSLLLGTGLSAQKGMQDRSIQMGQKSPISSAIRGQQRVDQATDLPIVVYNTDITVTQGSIEERARIALNLLRNTLGFSPADLDNLEVYFQREGLAGTNVRFQQSWQGVPVHNGRVNLTFSSTGKVKMVGNDFIRGVSLPSVQPAITLSSAKSAALEYINPTVDIYDESNDLRILDTDQGAKLAYRVFFVAMEPLGQWEVFVDAQTGDLLRVTDVAAYHNERHQEGSLPFPMMVEGQGNVFDPDPLSSAGASYGDAGYTDNSDNNTPQLVAEQRTVTLPEVTEEGGMFFLKGQYAEITDEESPNRGLFEQATPEWLFDRADNAFEATNVYYHIDASMRYLNETLGIAVRPTLYTTGVKCDPSGLNNADNSWYIGGTQRLAWGDGGVDDAEDSDVVHHELGHGLHDWITGGGLSQNQGLSEGCGDYWAASYNRSLGDWTSADPQYFWIFNWDGHNSFWSGRSCGVSTTWAANLSGGIHTQGQVWSTSMMLVWDAIGQMKTDKIFWEGIAMTNGSANQNDAANAVYQAALDCPGITQADALQVHTILTDRGYVLPEFSLPVEWLSFSATPDQKSVVLDWSVVELTSSHFLVERSIDNGRSFSAIGRLVSLGDNPEAQAYYFADNYPVSGRNIYRIRQVDNDGSASLSDVVSVSFDDESAGGVVPNPTDGVIQIRLSAAADTPLEVKVMNLAGRKIMEFSNVTPGSNFSVADLLPGVYLVSYTDGNRTVSRRFVRR